MTQNSNKIFSKKTIFCSLVVCGLIAIIDYAFVYPLYDIEYEPQDGLTALKISTIGQNKPTLYSNTVAYETQLKRELYTLKIERHSGYFLKIDIHAFSPEGEELLLIPHNDILPSCLDTHDLENDLNSQITGYHMSWWKCITIDKNTQISDKANRVNLVITNQEGEQIASERLVFNLKKNGYVIGYFDAL